MAVITNAVDTTSVADRTNTEWIDTVTYWAAAGPTIWKELVFVKDMTGAKSDTYTHNIRARLSAASAHTDSDEFSSNDLTSTDTNTTTAEYGSASFVADRANRLSVEPEDAVAIEANVYACNLKIDTAVHTLATSMTSIGSAATVNTLDNLITVISTWKATAFNVVRPPILVMHLDAFRDLRADLGSNGAALLGSNVGEQLHQAVSSVSMGMLMPFGGVFFLESSHVVAGDTTGWSNFMISVGEQDGALVMPVGMDINTELERVGSRRGTWFTAALEFGAGIRDSSRALRFITRT
jgi:hypothetical protein